MATLLVGLIAALFAADDNLLLNPGFDHLGPQGHPLHWDVFVQPQKGAFGDVDKSDLSGPFAARLHTPDVYLLEPHNNWSQILLDDFSDRSLKLTASIKTENLTSAGVWVQCWATNPRRVLATYGNAEDQAVSGTREWSELSMEFSPPKGTEFLLVRCIIAGTGTAWFDNISLTEREPIALEIADPVEVAEDLPAPKNISETDSTERNLEATLDEVRRSNESISEEVSQLISQLDALRLELKRGELQRVESEKKDTLINAPQQPIVKIPQPVTVKKPATYGHPLVPRAPAPEPRP